MIVVEWINTWVGKKDSIGGMGGWYEHGHRWCHFIEGMLPPDLVYFEALRERVLTDNIRHGGDWHQSRGIPLFSDGTVALFTFRAWGDFLAAVWSEKEDKDYSYNDFYMGDG